MREQSIWRNYFTSNAAPGPRATLTLKLTYFEYFKMHGWVFCTGTDMQKCFHAHHPWKHCSRWQLNSRMSHLTTGCWTYPTSWSQWDKWKGLELAHHKNRNWVEDRLKALFRGFFFINFAAFILILLPLFHFSSCLPVWLCHFSVLLIYLASEPKHSGRCVFDTQSRGSADPKWPLIFSRFVPAALFKTLSLQSNRVEETGFISGCHLSIVCRLFQCSGSLSC